MIFYRICSIKMNIDMSAPFMDNICASKEKVTIFSKELNPPSKALDLISFIPESYAANSHAHHFCF